MSTVTLDLGHLDLLSTKSKLHVATTVSADFSTEDDTFLADGTQLLELLKSCSAWACRGSGLHVSIRFLLHGADLTRCIHVHDLLRSLGTTIETAKLWDQLDLNVKVLTECVGDANLEGNPHLTIYVRHAFAKDRSGRQLHRLAQGITPHDVKPPPGFPTVHLRRVAITIDFQSQSHALAEDIIFDDTISACVVDMCPIGHEYITLEDALASVDATLRLWIAPKAKRLGKGFKVISDGRAATLDEIMPGLWRSGYMEALAERACLMPTVSHAVKGFAMRQTRSTKLQYQLRRLALANAVENPANCDLTPDDNLESVQVQILSKSILIRLWTSAQKVLRDRIPRRHLEPMKQGTHMLGDDGDLEMLKEIQAEDDRVAISPGKEDELTDLEGQILNDDCFDDLTKFNSTGSDICENEGSWDDSGQASQCHGSDMILDLHSGIAFGQNWIEDWETWACCYGPPDQSPMTPGQDKTPRFEWATSRNIEDTGLEDADRFGCKSRVVNGLSGLPTSLRLRPYDFYKGDCELQQGLKSMVEDDEMLEL